MGARKEADMTYESKIREHLMGRGFTNAEASKEAFNAINAIAAGDLCPETAESEYGLAKDDIEKIYAGGR